MDQLPGSGHSSRGPRARAGSGVSGAHHPREKRPDHREEQLRHRIHARGGRKRSLIGGGWEKHLRTGPILRPSSFTSCGSRGQRRNDGSLTNDADHLLRSSGRRARDSSAHARPERANGTGSEYSRLYHHHRSGAANKPIAIETLNASTLFDRRMLASLPSGTESLTLAEAETHLQSHAASLCGSPREYRSSQ